MGIRNGYSIIYNNKGSVYFEGYFKDGLIDGPGVYKMNDGKVFDGEWVKYKMKKGILIEPNGD